MGSGTRGGLVAGLAAALISAPVGCGDSANCIEGWCSVSVPTSAVSFEGVWGSGSNDIWVVGDGGTILHWNGSAWSSARSGTLASLLAVWGTGPDVWAVGHTEGAGKLVTNLVDADWLAGKIGLVPKLNCVWGSGPSDVWAGGDEGTMIHFTGASFSSVATASPESIRGIWGSGPNDVWAVGESNTIQHWDGTAWSLVDQGEIYLRFNGIWGSGPSDVWAVGDLGVVYRWDGVRWAAVPFGAGVDLTAVWGSSSSDVWILGGNGTVWHADALGADPPQLRVLLKAVWGSAPGDVWAVGSTGTVATIFHHQPSGP
jgi:hypothetical protein